jgi:threonine/homoserine/homoserine lactone efflux protein
MIAALFIGLAFGFFGSIPVAGPIAALVLKRGIEARYRAAFLIGISAALAEAIYAFLSFWGFSAFLKPYPFVEPLSKGVAAAILIGLGISFARYVVTQKEEDEKKRDDSTWGSLALGFTITALNPTLIATWTAATTTLYSTGLVDLAPREALPFALGSFIGIAGWFSAFTWILKRYAGRFNPRWLERGVRVIGVLLIGLGAWFGFRFVSYWLAG